jgi:hypothetical protein
MKSRLGLAGAIAFVALLAPSMAAADELQYAVSYSISDRGSIGFATGLITTDGTIGALQPANILDAEKSWRRLNGHNQLPKIILGIKFTDGMEVVRSQTQIAAA